MNLIEAALSREVDVPLPFPPDEVGTLPVEPDAPEAPSLSGQWETPPDLFRQLDAEFGFTLDAAATAESALCGKYFTPEVDGLRQDWSGERVWLNPPYGRGQIPLWLGKVREEQGRGVMTVALLPALTDTRWFHELCAPCAEVRFVRGRLTFRHKGQALSTARFPSLIAIYRPCQAPYTWVIR